MKRTLLLPCRFKKIGWAILVPTLTLGVFMLLDGLNGLPESWFKSCASLHTETASRFFNNLAIIGIIIGSIFITCSKEKVEDEMISALRMDSLLLTLYIDFGLLIVASLFVYDFAYLDVMVVNLCALPILFMLIWNTKKYLMERRMDNEK